MASISGVSLSFAGGATSSANVRTPAEANTKKNDIQSVTAPQAGANAGKGAANDVSATQSVSSLLEAKGSAVDNQARPATPPPPRNDTDGDNDRESVADVAQERTVNAVESQLQTARVQQQATVAGNASKVTAANEPDATKSNASESTAQTSTQKAFVSSQTAEKGLGLSVDTRG